MCIRDSYWVDSSIVSPLRLRWFKGVCAVRCNLPPALFWQNDRGLQRVIAVTRGWSGHRTKSHHTKLTLEKKILQPLLPGFELRTIPSRVQRSYQQAIQALSSIASLLLYVVVCMGAVVCWLIELHVVSPLWPLSSIQNTIRIDLTYCLREATLYRKLIADFPIVVSFRCINHFKFFKKNTFSSTIKITVACQKMLVSATFYDVANNEWVKHFFLALPVPMQHGLPI